MARCPKRALEGRRTCLKYVSAWSTGFEPARIGRILGAYESGPRYKQPLYSDIHRQVTPSHIWERSPRATRNGRMPRFSEPTTRRAKTIPTRGIPANGPVGGMNLLIVNERYPSDSIISLTYLAAPELGVCRSNSPVGSNVAVVSMLKASSPWETSVRRNWPLCKGRRHQSFARRMSC